MTEGLVRGAGGVGAGGGVMVGLNVSRVEDTRRAEGGEHGGSRSGRSGLRVIVARGALGTGGESGGTVLCALVGSRLSRPQFPHWDREG